MIMLSKRILIMLYIVGGIGCTILLYKMLSTIDKITPDKIIFVTCESCPIYIEPSVESFVLTELQKSDKIEYVRTEGDWVLIRNGPFEGYVKLLNTSLSEEIRRE